MGGIYSFVAFLPVSALAVFTGFLLHEMAHKYMAFRYGYPAAFQAWFQGLLIALAMSLIGFLFAAPGAVMVYGMPGRRENGIISAAGPATNLVVGFALLVLSIFVSPATFVLSYVAYFNFFLAFFNLLPIPPMDGTKILSWNVAVYAILLVGAIGGIAYFYIP
jgi:Zn-dependent protease